MIRWRIFAFCCVITLCFYIPAVFIAVQANLVLWLRLPLAILVASLGVMLGIIIYTKKVQERMKLFWVSFQYLNLRTHQMCCGTLLIPAESAEKAINNQFETIQASGQPVNKEQWTATEHKLPPHVDFNYSLGPTGYIIHFFLKKS